MAHPERVGSEAPLQFLPLTDALIPAVDAFHARLEAGGGPHYRFGTHVPPDDGSSKPPVSLETIVAFDGEEVRGGIMVQRQQAFTATGLVPVINIQLPLSEGTIDRRFANVGMWLIRQAARLEPRLFAVGMGGLDKPLPRLLHAMRWHVAPVPFRFYVHRPGHFFRALPALRRSPVRRVLAAGAAATGAGWLGVRAVSRLTAWRAGGLRQGRGRRLRIEALPHWTDAVNAVWQAARDDASFCTVRDDHTLPILYPPDGRTRCFAVRDGDRLVGWFVLLVTAMRGSDYFGDMSVGTLLDAQCVPGYERDVVAAARATLDDHAVDLSVTNLLHRAWQLASDACGFLPAASNYLFAASPALVRAAGGEHEWARMHVTRGDGDGRINL